MLRRVRRLSLGILAAAASLLAGADARAVSYPLTVELEGGDVGTIASADVIEAAGDLGFVITLDPSLSADRELREVCFDVAGGFGLSPADGDITVYSLSMDPFDAEGAGSDLLLRSRLSTDGATIPEPGTLTLLLAGLAGLCVLTPRLRRR